MVGGLHVGLAFWHTPDALHDDKLALLYKANEENKVAVRTPVGLTDRKSIPTIVMQGGDLWPHAVFQFHR